MAGFCTALFRPREVTQLLLLGLEGSGKSTLLYRLKMGNHWKKEEIIRDMAKIQKENVNFHYEEFRNPRMSYGIWDVPGSPYIRADMWEFFYRYVNIDVVLFMINADTLINQNVKVKERLEDVRNLIRILVYEDEIRQCPFCILINDRGGMGGQMPDDEDIREILDLNTLELTGEDKVKIFKVVAPEIDEDHKDWRKVLNHIKKQLLAQRES